MKRKNFFLLLFLILMMAGIDLYSAALSSFSQTTDQVMIVQRGKPERIIGTATYEDERIIRVKRDDGTEIAVEKTTILSLVRGVRYGAGVVERDPASSRSIIGPTGRPLASGHGYISLSGAPWPGVLVPNLGFGLGRFLTVNAGLAVTRYDSMYVFLNGKASFLQREKIKVSAGALYVTLPDRYYSGSFGSIYGIGTFGGETASLNLGLGFGFSGEGVSSKPIYIIGGQFPVSPRVRVLIENWTTFHDFNLSCLGLRFFTKNIAFDVSFVIPWSSDGLTFWPIMTPAYNFKF